MLFDSRISENKPESIILDILSKKPRMRTKDMYDLFCSKYPKSITIQGFYKIIRNMLNDRILVKDGGLLSIDTIWINRLVDFIDMLKQNYLEIKALTAHVLMDEGETNTFTFDNIVKMDNFWGHALNMVKHFYLDNNHENKNAYSKNYFALFQIARTESENVIIHSFESADMKWYMASANQTFLNKLVPKIIDDDNFHFINYSMNGNREHTLFKNYWVTVIGDYIFESRLPKYIFELIEKIYNEVQSIAEFNADKINYLFLEPGKSKLTISKNKNKAEIIRQEIKSLFEK